MKFRRIIKTLEEQSLERRADPLVNRWIARVGLGLLVGTAALSYWAAQMYLQAETWRGHSSEVLSQMTGAELSIRSAEAALRGYLLRQKPEYLEELKSSEATAEQRLGDIRGSVEDNPAQLALLDRALDHLRAREEFWSEVVRMEAAGDYEKAKRTILGPRAPELREALTALIEELKVAENKLLVERTWNSKRDFELSVWIVTLSLGLSFALLLFVMRNLRGEIARRQAVELELVGSKLEAEEASRIKSQFLANMSHEFRTPLAPRASKDV